MKKLYSVICGKYRKFEKPKISYLLEKTLVFSIICSKCKNKKESIEILKILDLITLKMAEESISQEFRLKNIDQTRNYLSEEIN